MVAMPGTIPRFDASATAEEVAAAIRDHGAAVVERLVDEATCDRVVEEMAPWIDATPYGADAFSGTATRRTGAI